MTLFLDIDGTLLDHGSGPFDDDVEAIRAFRQRGGKAFLNTGRSFANIPAALLHADWIDGAVCGGGAHVLLREADKKYRTVYRRRIPPGVLRAAAAFFIKTGRWCLFEGETAVYTLNRCDNGLPNADSGVVTSEDFFDETSSDQKTSPITKLTMQGDIFLEEEQILSPYMRLFRQNGYHEAVLLGETKSKGMETVLWELGEDIDDSIAIGDSANDLDMIRVAGFGAALGNACEELKAAADYVSAPVGSGGIARALTRISEYYTTRSN